MELKKFVCRVCNSEESHPSYIFREMMFGTCDAFEYFKCEVCGCLQIGQIPAELGQYYPTTYYSFNPQEEPPTPKHAIKATLERWRIRNALFGYGYKLAKLASYLVDFPSQLSSVGPWLKICGIKSMDARFLDVGCGSSSWWLRELRELGFRNLLGIDPFIDRDVEEGGIHILKQHPQRLSGEFDLVTLHHSLEHIPNQVETLKAVRAILKPKGFCLVRVPLVSSEVWETYGADWVELDAPRHLYLHSLSSIELLGANAGLRLVDRCWDSTAFEFWGSEQYRRGIPLMAEESFHQNPSKSDFTYREMADFKKHAEEVNLAGRGGRGCFFFQATD